MSNGQKAEMNSDDVYSDKLKSFITKDVDSEYFPELVTKIEAVCLSLGLSDCESPARLSRKIMATCRFRSSHKKKQARSHSNPGNIR